MSGPNDTPARQRLLAKLRALGFSPEQAEAKARAISDDVERLILEGSDDPDDPAPPGLLRSVPK